MLEGSGARSNGGGCVLSGSGIAIVVGGVEPKVCHSNACVAEGYNVRRPGPVVKGECLRRRCVDCEREHFVSRDRESGCCTECADDMRLVLAEVQLPCRGTEVIGVRYVTSRV